MKLREEGKLQQLQDNWWKSRGECEVDDLNSKVNHNLFGQLKRFNSKISISKVSHIFEGSN